MQGCQVGPFGVKFQKFRPKQHLLATTCSFGPLAFFLDGFGPLQELGLTTRVPV